MDRSQYGRCGSKGLLVESLRVQGLLNKGGGPARGDSHRERHAPILGTAQTHDPLPLCLHCKTSISTCPSSPADTSLGGGSSPHPLFILAMVDFNASSGCVYRLITSFRPSVRHRKHHIPQNPLLLFSCPSAGWSTSWRPMKRSSTNPTSSATKNALARRAELRARAPIVTAKSSLYGLDRSVGLPPWFDCRGRSPWESRPSVWSLTSTFAGPEMLQLHIPCRPSR